MWTLVVAALQLIAQSIEASKRKLAPEVKDASVTALNIYPVKSCAAITVKSWYIDKCGFELDRQWLIVDADMKMMTQRDTPKMVLIKPRLDAKLDTPGAYARGGRLILSAPGMKKDLSVEFRKTFDGLPTHKFKVFSDSVEGIDEGDDASEWLSEFLGRPCRLMIKSPAFTRELQPKHTPPRSYLDHHPQTGFSDGFPFLILSEPSVRDLRARVSAGTAVSHLNFRPNIVVDGSFTAHAEDWWKRVQVGDVPFYIASRCGRCTMPGNDPTTGVMGKEPVKVISQYRRVDPGSKYESCFGMNAIAGRTGCKVSVGDKIDVVEVTEQHDMKKGIWKE
ncbi:hypothetical protein HK101_008473, partial [Irineochytrium annulatum]